MISFHGACDPGCVRADNEDRILMDPELGFFVVADGMGGHQHGELAAELGISTMKYYLESSRSRYDVTWPFGYNFNLSLDANRLVTGIQLANRQVWKRAEEAPEYAGMGTTIAAVLIEGNSTALANVGDSRVYLFHARELTQLTVDDTWISAVLERGILDKTAIRNHPMRNVLTQAIGSQHDINVHVADIDLQDGDLLLVSSDGLHGVIGDEAVEATLRGGGSLDQRTARLVAAARAEGGPDNISCVLLAYSDAGTS